MGRSIRPQNQPLPEAFRTRKGTIGELKVQTDLTEKKFDVYLPLVDDYGVDLIVETKAGFKRVQVKTIQSPATKSSIEVRLQKYARKKLKDRVDIFAIFYSPKNIIAYVEWDGELSINLALEEAYNKQRKGVRWFYQYMNFPFPPLRD